MTINVSIPKNAQTLISSSNAPIAAHTQHIMPGLTCEWYANEQIVAYRITEVSRTVVNQWADMVIQIIENWPSDKPYLALHDVSASGISLQYAVLVNFDTINIGVTAAGRNRVQKILEEREQPVRIAMNFNISLSGQVNKVLADNRNMRFRNGESMVTYRTFYNYDQALQWLATSSNPNLTLNTVTLD